MRVVARLANDVLRDSDGRRQRAPARFWTSPTLRRRRSSRHVWRTPCTRSRRRASNSSSPAPRHRVDATLREIYGDLAPVAVIHGENCATPGEVVSCPGRDLSVHAGDWTAMIGTADELAARGIKVPRPTATRSACPGCGERVDAARALRDDVNPMFSRACGRGVEPADRVDGGVALLLPAASEDDLGRRLVLQHRDDRDGGLRRLQLPRNSPRGCDCSASC